MKKCVLLSVFFVVCILLLAGFIIYQRESFRKLQYDLLNRNFEVERKLVLLENEDLPYYNLSRDSILRLLPSPEDEKYVYISRNNWLSEHDWLYYIREKYVHSDKDSILVNQMYWRIPAERSRIYPYTNKSDLYIGFIQKAGVWIAVYCVQWDPKVVRW